MSTRIPQQRPASSPAPQPTRKVFNCIVEDSALVAGVKRSTRNGLRQWVKNGQIRLFVPLHALEQLNKQKAESAKNSEDIKETLDWLDQATTKFPYAVTLQGGDETFQQWSEVERFVVPRSLFSEHDHEQDEDEEDDSSIQTGSPKSTRAKVEAKSKTQQHAEHENVPEPLQPLFNYILWRIHQEINPVAALESFIFLCNDSVKANLAKGFEVRCKRLEQLREAVGREERDFKAHRSSQSISSVSVDKEQSPSISPPVAPAAMLNSQAKLIDPDDFDRTVKLTSSNTSTPRNNGSQRGRGNPRARRGNTPSGSPILSRVDLAAKVSRLRGDSINEVGPQIDPNSFERPRGGHTGRGGRRLWTPG